MRELDWDLVGPNPTPASAMVTPMLDAETPPRARYWAMPESDDPSTELAFYRLWLATAQDRLPEPVDHTVELPEVDIEVIMDEVDELRDRSPD